MGKKDRGEALANVIPPAKAKKARQVLGTVYPVSGSPYEVVVEVSSNNTIEHEGMSWVVASNSIWSDGKRRRTILPEGQASTLTCAMASGKSYLNARMFLLFMKMNLLEQLFKLQNQKPWFKQSATWIIAGCILFMALILMWLASATGKGFEHVTDAVNQLQTHLAASPSPSPTPTSGTIITSR